MAVAFRRLKKVQVLPEAEVRVSPAPPKDLTWEAAITLFLEGWAADHPGIRPGTLGHYRDQMRTRIAAFARERGITNVGDFSRYDLRAFVGWLESFVSQHQRPLTPRGKQMALDSARRFFGWLYQERILPEDICQHVAKYRLDKDLEPRATPGAALEKMLASLDLSSPVGVRNLAMIQVMAFCGLRVAEMVGLNGNDLDMDAGRIRVRAENAKGRRTRFVDLPLTIVDGEERVKPEVAGLMASWLRLRSGVCPHLSEEDPLFITLGSGQQLSTYRKTGEAHPGARPPGERLTTDAVRTILTRIAEKAGVDPALATPRRLRHYFGLTSAMAGVPTTALMRAMGHRSPIRRRRTSHDRPLLGVRRLPAAVGFRAGGYHQRDEPASLPRGNAVALSALRAARHLAAWRADRLVSSGRERHMPDPARRGYCVSPTFM